MSAMLVQAIAELRERFDGLWRIQTELRSAWESLKLDPDNQELKRRHDKLAAQWQARFAEYAGLFEKWGR